MSPSTSYTLVTVDDGQNPQDPYYAGEEAVSVTHMLRFNMKIDNVLIFRISTLNTQSALLQVFQLNSFLSESKMPTGSMDFWIKSSICLSKIPFRQCYRRVML